MSKLTRRDVLKTGLAGAAVANTFGVAAQNAKAPPWVPMPPAPRRRATLRPRHRPNQPWEALFFNSDEARFVGAVVDRLIPADDTWVGAKDAGVLNFIDGQLAGAYGAGASMYLEAPGIRKTPLPPRATSSS